MATETKLTRAQAIKAFGVCRGVYHGDDHVECSEPRASKSNALCKAHSDEYKAGVARMSASGFTKLMALPEDARAYGSTSRPKANRDNGIPSAAKAMRSRKPATMESEIAAVKAMKRREARASRAELAAEAKGDRMN